MINIVMSVTLQRLIMEGLNTPIIVIILRSPIWLNSTTCSLIRSLNEQVYTKKILQANKCKTEKVSFSLHSATKRVPCLLTLLNHMKSTPSLSGICVATVPFCFIYNSGVILKINTTQITACVIISVIFYDVTKLFQ